MSTDTAGTSTEQGGTTHAELASWVKEVAELTQPDSIHWVTGSAEEIESLNQALVASGTFVKLDEEKKPNSYWAASQPSDVARVEDKTFICSETEEGAGFTALQAALRARDAGRLNRPQYAITAKTGTKPHPAYTARVGHFDVPGGALASTGVAKLFGACRGGSFPR